MAWTNSRDSDVIGIEISKLRIIIDITIDFIAIGYTAIRRRLIRIKKGSCCLKQKPFRN
jgi:hypothetical protein